MQKFKECSFEEEEHKIKAGSESSRAGSEDEETARMERRNAWDLGKRENNIKRERVTNKEKEYRPRRSLEEEREQGETTSWTLTSTSLIGLVNV